MKKPRKKVHLLRSITLLLCFMLPAALISCDKQPDSSKKDGSDATDLLPVIVDGASDYTVIRPEVAEPEVISAATRLSQALESATGVRLTFTDDWVERGSEAPTDTKEILVGLTNRAESQEVFATLGKGEYTVTVKNDRVVVIGADAAATAAAVDMLISDVMGYSAHTNSYRENNLQLPTDFSLLAKLQETEKVGVIEEVLNTKHTLRFNKNGEFRILVLSDTHFKSAPVPEKDLENIITMIDREQPDLVVFNGDNTDAVTNTDDLEEILSQMVAYIEECAIPWMHVFGNHDDAALSREAQQPVYESFEYCISKAGDESVPGVGNYVIPVLASDSDDIVFAVWALDSFREMTAAEMNSIRPVKGSFRGMGDDRSSHYGYIRPSQIQWYLNTSQALEDHMGKQVPGIMAFHIPLQETYTAYLNRDELDWDGEKQEAIGAGELNSGLFAACMERGDIKAIISGHDHNNTFRYNYCDIDLCACGTISTSGYHTSSLLGGRMVVLNEKNPEKIDTYMSYLTPRRDPIDADEVDDLAGGTVLTFESLSEVSLTSPSNTGEIKLDEGRDADGSNMLGITRHAWSDTPHENNMFLYMNIPEPGLLGDLAYLRVRIDMTGDLDKMDFRKADFGIISNYDDAGAYCTDNNDESFTPFYMLEDGSDTWVTKKNGNDGCFGAAQSSSVKGFTGYLAFPIKYMYNPENTAPSEDTVVTGIYFYCALAAEEMVDDFAYIGNVELVEDYRDFD